MRGGCGQYRFFRGARRERPCRDRERRFELAAVARDARLEKISTVVLSDRIIQWQNRYIICFRWYLTF
jgi:hypothetical protein